MSDLTRGDLKKLKSFLQGAAIGKVLNFRFDPEGLRKHILKEINVDICDKKFQKNGNSDLNRLMQVFEIVPNHQVIALWKSIGSEANRKRSSSGNWQDGILNLFEKKELDKIIDKLHDEPVHPDLKVLTSSELRHVETLFIFQDGILNLNDEEFKEIVQDTTHLNIDDLKYGRATAPYIARFKKFIRLESREKLFNLLTELMQVYDEKSRARMITRSEATAAFNVKDVLKRLESSNTIAEVDIFSQLSEMDSHGLSQFLQEAIRKGDYKVLDRLHTWLMGFFRKKCRNYQISVVKDYSLHALVSMYLKELRSENKFEATITERIFKTTSHVLEGLNEVRNDKSYAHANPILGKAESILIIKHVVALVNFINEVDPD